MGATLVSLHAPAARSDAVTLARQCRLCQDGLVFAEVLDHVPDMIMIVNDNRQLVYANAAVLKFYGTDDVHSVLGKRPGEILGCAHAQETAGGCGTTLSCRYCGAVNSILAAQGSAEVTEECRVRVTGNQSTMALDLRLLARRLSIGPEQFTFLALVDIAGEKRRAFLEGTFLHDIMNTATALRGFSTLMSAGPIADAMREHYMRRVKSLSDRLVDEIQGHQLLVVAESADLKPEFRLVHSLAIVHSVQAAYGRPEMLNGRNLTLAQDVDDAEFSTDPILLERVLGYMVKNAIEASMPGETVTLSCSVGANMIAFAVHNRTYMPENVRAQVFNRWFSTKGAGRGLGTYSMKFLTERYLGGLVDFTSNERNGTTFTAAYPLKRTARQAA